MKNLGNPDVLREVDAAIDAGLVEDVQNAGAMIDKLRALKAGDVLTVTYHGAQVAFLQVTKVNRFSAEGLDGDVECKITIVGMGAWFYAPLDTKSLKSARRFSKLRPITFAKVGARS